jgi:hypothetical protein
MITAMQQMLTSETINFNVPPARDGHPTAQDMLDAEERRWQLEWDRRNVED